MGNMEEMKAVKVIGKGAMGTVFLVRKQGFESPLALKAMSKCAMKQRSGAFKRCDMENEVLSEIQAHPHPFLPTLHAHVETDRVIGWVGEYCPGGDLNVLRLSQSERTFSESVIRFYAAEIVLALEHLHSLGVVYRDLKPENILVQADGHIMLTDFDLSTRHPPPEPPVELAEDARRGKPAGRDCLLSSIMMSCRGSHAKSSSTQVKRSNHARVSPVNRTRKDDSASLPTENCRSNSFVGTEEYVSPEMVRGAGHGFAVDWWALGILLYEMLHGKTPFRGVTRKETFYNILVQQPLFEGPWTPLRHLILQLLQKDPRARLGSSNGALDIKRHLFFRSLDWDAIPHVSRPPFVPSLQPHDAISNPTPDLDIDEYLHGDSPTLDSTTRTGNASPEQKLDTNRQLWPGNPSKSVQEIDSFGLF